MDTSKALTGSDSANYNSVMTTKDEFLKILEDMYQNMCWSASTMWPMRHLMKMETCIL